MKTNNFQGDVTDISAKRELLAAMYIQFAVSCQLGIDVMQSMPAAVFLLFCRYIGLVTPKTIYFYCVENMFIG